MKLKPHNLGKFLVAIIVFVGVASLFIGSLKTSRVSAEDASTQSYVTIYDDGTKTVVKSSEITVREMLTEAKIPIDEKADIVEPTLDTPITGKDFYINIYRAHPALVIDGTRTAKLMTASTVPRDVAATAGIDLFPEDVVKITTNGNFQASGIPFAYQIVRAKLVHFDFYGTTIEARTQANTIANFLAERSIEITAEDWLSLAPSTPITDGIKLSLYRNGKNTIVVEEDIESGEQVTYDYEQPLGYRLVTQSGTLGKKAVTYEIEMQDGTEISRKEISEIVTIEPTPAQVTIGKKQKPTTTPSENEDIAWGYLRAQGFSREQTAGIMGNLMQEHHFQTSDSAGGLGIVQWTSGRRRTLIAQHPDDWESIHAQLDFLMFELNSGYASVKRNLLASTTVEDAVRIFQNHFEKCGNCREDRRIGYAYEILGRHEE